MSNFVSLSLTLKLQASTLNTISAKPESSVLHSLGTMLLVRDGYSQGKSVAGKLYGALSRACFQCGLYCSSCVWWFPKIWGTLGTLSGVCMIRIMALGVYVGIRCFGKPPPDLDNLDLGFVGFGVEGYEMYFKKHHNPRAPNQQQHSQADAIHLIIVGLGLLLYILFGFR